MNFWLLLSILAFIEDGLLIFLWCNKDKLYIPRFGFNKVKPQLAYLLPQSAVSRGAFFYISCHIPYAMLNIISQDQMFLYFIS